MPIFSLAVANVAVVLAASNLPSAESAQMRALPIAPALLVAFQGIGNQNVCFQYTYDKNGNRTAKSNLTWGGGATWGTSIYGCALWTPSP